MPKSAVSISIQSGEHSETFADIAGTPFHPETIQRPNVPGQPQSSEPLTQTPLIKLAWGRSGDKGNKSNIGILPRDPAYAPWIWASLGTDIVRERFAHFLEKPDAAESVERFYLPGTGAINFLLHDILGGGGIASMRNDPQGKSYAQILLATPISIPQSLAEKL